MALSQLQKKILDKIPTSPEDILLDIKKGNININSFKNEFYQDGRGFLHILMDSYSHDKERFTPLLKFVLNNSNLSIEDSKGRQNSVFADVAFNFYKDKALVSQDTIDTLYFLIKESGDKISDSSINRSLKYFSDYKKDNYFNEIINTRKNLVDDYNWYNIIDNTIVQDNLAQLKFILEEIPSLKEKIESVKSTSLARNTHNTQEASSFLTLAVAKSESITNYFLDNYDFNLNGKVKKKEAYLYPNYDGLMGNTTSQAMPVIIEAFNSKKSTLFFNIFNKLKDKQLNNLLHKIGMDNSSISLLNAICMSDDKSYYNFVKSNIKEILENNPNNFNRKTFFNIITSHPNVSIEDKLFFSTEMAHNIVEMERIKNNNLLGGFFVSIYSQKLSPEDVNCVGKIYDKVNKSHNTIANGADIYRLPLFNNSQLLNVLIANGLDIIHSPDIGYNNTEKINPFHWYFKLTEKLNGIELQKLYDSTDITEINKVFNTFKLIAPEQVKIKYNNHNILEYALFKLDLTIINNLSKDEIKEYSADPAFLKSLSNPIDLFKDNYNNICNILYENDVKFFPEGKKDYFYKILCFCDDHALIDKILIKENKNIYELSQDASFWDYVVTPKISDYVKRKGADFSSVSITNKIALSNANVFSLYIQNGGNVDYKDENKDNVLHFLIKNNMWVKAKTVVEIHPELTQEINNQNKLPLSYMIVDFNKDCEKNKNRRPANMDSNFNKSMDLFRTYLTIGKLSTNPKSKKILEEQMKKYTHIKELIPEVDSLLLYKNIEAVIPDEKYAVKEKKLKI